MLLNSFKRVIVPLDHCFLSFTIDVVVVINAGDVVIVVALDFLFVPVPNRGMIS